MNYLKRLWYQLTRAKQSSVRLPSTGRGHTASVLIAEDPGFFETQDATRATGGDLVLPKVVANSLHKWVSDTQAIIDAGHRTGKIIDVTVDGESVPFTIDGCKIILADDVLTVEVNQDHQSATVHVNPKTVPVPSAKFSQYQGDIVPKDKLETIRFKLSRPDEFPLKDPAYCALSKDKDQFSINTGELHRLIDEVVHYRENQASFEQFEAIFYLLARDIIFFSTFNDKVKDYIEGFSMVIQVNDTFYVASADAHEMDPEDAPILKDLFLRFGYCGIVAWVARDREQDPLPALRTDKYYEAREYLTTWRAVNKEST